MARFVLYWDSNKAPEVIHGETIARAFSQAGYGGGAIAALDFYAEEKKDQESLSDEELITANRL